MKQIILLFLLYGKMAWPQVESGTVIFVHFSQNDVTMSADSRTNLSTGEHNDNECKLSAFGDKFVFSMAGVVKQTAKENAQGSWGGHAIARRIWESESKIETDAEKLVSAVSAKWVTEMEKIYKDPKFMRGHVREAPGVEVLANAFFAATDKIGISAKAVNIGFDLPLFNRTGWSVRFVNDIPESIPQNSWRAGGHGEIITEFMAPPPISQRAVPFAKEFRTVNPILGPRSREQTASMAMKLIELSVELHPQRDELGLPVDVLQLQRGTGVLWIARKVNCPEN